MRDCDDELIPCLFQYAVAFVIFYMREEVREGPLMIYTTEKMLYFYLLFYMYLIFALYPLLECSNKTDKQTRIYASL
jgi:hypothetical protein